MLSVRELGDTEGALERVLYPLKVTPVRKESHWISRTGNQQRTGWIFPANITAQILSLSGVFIWYSWSPYWTYYLLWGFGNCLLHRKLWIREEKKPTLNVGVRTVCHLRTRSLTSGRCSTCIFKCLNERKIFFISWPKCQKSKKVIEGLIKSKFRSNIYLNIPLYLKLWFTVFCCFRTVRIAELQVRKVLCLTLKSYSLTDWNYWNIKYIYCEDLHSLFSQGSCSLCSLSYAAEHPNFLEHSHTQIDGFKTPHDSKKFWLSLHY